MQTIYRLNSKELNADLIKSIQNMYHDKDIELTVIAVEDETEYLLKDQQNRDHLLKAVKELEEGKNRVEVSIA